MNYRFFLVACILIAYTISAADKSTQQQQKESFEGLYCDPLNLYPYTITIHYMRKPRTEDEEDNPLLTYREVTVCLPIRTTFVRAYNNIVVRRRKFVHENGEQASVTTPPQGKALKLYGISRTWLQEWHDIYGDNYSDKDIVTLVQSAKKDLTRKYDKDRAQALIDWLES